MSRYMLGNFCGLIFIVSWAGCQTNMKVVNPPVSDPALQSLAWLAGSWSNNDGETSIEEHWTRPVGGTMLGKNRTVSNGQTVFFEYLRIESAPDGIVYLASPKGRQPPTSFKLTQIGAQHVTFENPQHDFPQRIMYRRQGDMLHGRIEGRQNGRPASEEWVWSLVNSAP